MMVPQRLAAQMWWGPFRRPFEAVMRRTLRRSTRIQTGMMKGMFFRGGLAQLLGIYEPSVQRTIIEHLGSGDVFYDIGASNGFFTLLGASLVGSDGLVYAFEPLPDNVTKIHTVSQLNNLTNCQVVESAVSNTTGLVKLHYSDNISTPSLLEGNLEDSLEVASVTLDDFVKSYRQPDLVKVDVEGVEMEVLLGAKTLLDRNREAPIWIIEVHSAENDCNVIRILNEHHYETSIISAIGKSNKSYPRHVLAVRHD